MGGDGNDTVTNMDVDLGVAFLGGSGDDTVVFMSGEVRDSTGFGGEDGNDQVITMTGGGFTGWGENDRVTTMTGGTFLGLDNDDTVTNLGDPATRTGDGYFDGGAGNDTMVNRYAGTFDKVDTVPSP